MPMKNPPHPRGFVFRQCIEPLGLSITDAAAALGVTRTTLSELVNGKRGISPEMAVRLSQVFGGSAESWLEHHGRRCRPRSDAHHAIGTGEREARHLSRNGRQAVQGLRRQRRKLACA